MFFCRKTCYNHVISPCYFRLSTSRVRTVIAAPFPRAHAFTRQARALLFLSICHRPRNSRVKRYGGRTDRRFTRPFFFSRAPKPSVAYEPHGFIGGSGMISAQPR